MKPTIGRIMHFYSRKGVGDIFEGPKACIVAGVIEDEGGIHLMVHVFGYNGVISPANWVRYVTDPPGVDAKFNMYAIFPTFTVEGKAPTSEPISIPGKRSEFPTSDVSPKSDVAKAAEQGFNTIFDNASSNAPDKPYGPYPLPAGVKLEETLLGNGYPGKPRCMFHYKEQQCLYQRGHEGGHRVN